MSGGLLCNPCIISINKEQEDGGETASYVIDMQEKEKQNEL